MRGTDFRVVGLALSDHWWAVFLDDVSEGRFVSRLLGWAICGDGEVRPIDLDSDTCDATVIDSLAANFISVVWAETEEKALQEADALIARVQSGKSNLKHPWLRTGV